MRAVRDAQLHGILRKLESYDEHHYLSDETDGERFSMQLTDDEKQELLRLVRESIESSLKGLPEPSPHLASPNLSALSGAFVTLRIHDNLRGCIGYVEPRIPLYLAVEEVGRKAAFEDPRFMPLSLEELDKLEIEISVLSPLQLINDINKVEVGKHGLMLDAGFTRGLLLPQVATENHWDREQFLRHTALKAGLPEEAWNRPNVHLYSFTTDTFSDSPYKTIANG